MSRRMLELVERARADRDPAALTRHIPYAAFMGITAALEGDELHGLMRFSDHLIGNSSLPALHGGTLGALLESTAIVQILWEAETAVLPRTINLTIDYLRSAKAVDTRAVATITRLGRRVANLRAEAWQEDRGRPVATATAHFLLAPLDPAAE